MEPQTPLLNLPLTPELFSYLRTWITEYQESVRDELAQNALVEDDVCIDLVATEEILDIMEQCNARTNSGSKSNT